MLNTLIEISDKAYTPEAYAYSKYLSNHGFNVNLTAEKVCRSEYDIGIRFLGFYPFWKSNKKNRCKFEIHEYHSLSTPPYQRFKDLVKSTLNSRPDARIFLNNNVKNALHFLPATPYIFRGMGVDSEFFTSSTESKEYHLVYSGSINGRPGLVEEIIKLSNLGFTILIIGSVSKEFVSLVSPHTNITLTGRVERDKLPKLYKKCIAGLNFTPDIYPFNIQDSTKTLEYCAAGIGVVSNRYKWINDFAASRKAKFLWLDQISNLTQLEEFEFFTPDISDLEWTHLLDSIDFIKFCKTGENN